MVQHGQSTRYTGFANGMRLEPRQGKHGLTRRCSRLAPLAAELQG